MGILATDVCPATCRAFPIGKLRREGQGSSEPLSAAAPLLSQNLFPIALSQNSPGTTEKRDSWFVVNVLDFGRFECRHFRDTGMSALRRKGTGSKMFGIVRYCPNRTNQDRFPKIM